MTRSVFYGLGYEARPISKKESRVLQRQEEEKKKRRKKKTRTKRKRNHSLRR